MQAPLPNLLTFALAAVLTVGTLDTASARHRTKHRAKPQATSSERWLRTAEPDHLVPIDRDGTPIIMKGYRSPAMMRDDKAGKLELEPKPARRADRPIKIPRGSSTYIPPPDPSPYSKNSPPAAALTRPTVQPYNPPPITTFSDRVNNAIQAYPLEKGVGNNPIDQQQFIRQRLNQP
jgi:hypothetical protein